ncbi:protease [Moniliophthora roreri MCA 2997]|uniref:Protease n=1 Tax=Moniliophthora roreri (strain MCA 2997) TaxID=1381753 RepID=V2WKS0_MONRO|nr:protease [Moniliophthora roreri MCA 2997]
MVELKFKIADKEFRENFMISGIGDEDMILGLPRLRYHNPRIDWETGEITFLPGQKLQIRKFMGVLDNTPKEVLIGAKIMASQELAYQQQKVKRKIDDLIPSYLQGY